MFRKVMINSMAPCNKGQANKHFETVPHIIKERANQYKAISSDAKFFLLTAQQSTMCTLGRNV